MTTENMNVDSVIADKLAKELDAWTTVCADVGIKGRVPHVPINDCIIELIYGASDLAW